MKIKNRVQWMCALTISLLICVGCSTPNRRLTCEEEAMVKQTLDQTSPRAGNNQPKAIQEFKFTFGSPCRKSKETYPTVEDAVSDHDIRLDNR